MNDYISFAITLRAITRLPLHICSWHVNVVKFESNCFLSVVNFKHTLNRLVVQFQKFYVERERPK